MIALRPRFRGAFSIVLLAAALGGCAATRPQSQVAEIAPGVFSLVERSGVLVLKPEELKMRAEQRALAVCAERKRALSIDESDAVDAQGADPAYAKIRFRCS